MDAKKVDVKKKIEKAEMKLRGAAFKIAENLNQEVMEASAVMNDARLELMGFEYESKRTSEKTEQLKQELETTRRGIEVIRKALGITYEPYNRDDEANAARWTSSVIKEILHDHEMSAGLTDTIGRDLNTARAALNNIADIPFTVAEVKDGTGKAAPLEERLCKAIKAAREAIEEMEIE